MRRPVRGTGPVTGCHRCLLSCLCVGGCEPAAFSFLVLLIRQRRFREELRPLQQIILRRLPLIVDLSSLEELARQVDSCRLCPLYQTRNKSVFGSGDPGARLMFVGEAPGYHEDRLGQPFVGQAGKLLDRLLDRIGLSRGAVFIANVLKCRPPGNRDPQAGEIEQCRGYLERQVSLIEPSVICTLGNFATKLLSGKDDGISRVHGKPVRSTMADREVTIFPVYHPAAALYTPSNLQALEKDFDQLAELLKQAGAAGTLPTSGAAASAAAPGKTSRKRDEPDPPPAKQVDGDIQLGLF